MAYRHNPCRISVRHHFPQEAYLPPGAQADTYYKEQYGTFGQLYYLLGFHHLYGSWWYLSLIASIGISLVICGLDRVIPLYRALKTKVSAGVLLFKKAALVQ